MALKLTATDFDTDAGPSTVAKDLDARPPAEREKLKKDHATALAQFAASAAFFSEQRQREVDDLKFVDFGEQWDPTVTKNRKGQDAAGGLPGSPARPTLVINQLRGPCQQVASQRRQARLALEFSAKGNGATNQTASVYEDIARGIQAESRAPIARNWACDRAEKSGMGAYRIDTEYCLETPTDDAAWNDQDIVYRRILNQGSVFWDPNAQEPDFSDGRYLFITQDLSYPDYVREYGDSELAAQDPAALTATGATAPKWVFTAGAAGATTTDDEHEGQTIRIAEYWQVVESYRTRVELEDGRSAFDDELPPGARLLKGGRSRKVKTRKVLWAKINAVEYLEEPQEWNGAYIPIVPVVWEEANVDGERRWTGIVRPAKDAAVSYNVMRSAQVETIGLATKAPYIGYMETIAPYLDWWKQANTRNFPILPVAIVRDASGNALPPPQRNVAEPAIQSITMAAHEAKDDVHSTSGIPPVALGQLDPHERSGKAIQALQQQSETGSSGGLDNLATISIAYEGKILRDLIPRILDRPKRIVPAVGLDEKRALVMLNFPYKTAKDGTPTPLPPMVDPRTGHPREWQKGDPVPPGYTYIDLAAGEYGVAVTVGKSYPTRKAEASAAIANVLQVVPPEMAAAIAPAWLAEQDYPGALKISEIAKKSLPPPLQAAYEDDQGDTEIPPQVKAQLQQLQQQLQQAQQIIETDQAKQAGMLQKAQLDNQAKMQLATMDAEFQRWKATLDAETKLAVASISAQSADKDREVQVVEMLTGVAKEDRLEQHTRTHEHVQNDLQRQHERDMAERQHAQTLEQAAAGVQGDAALADQSQQHALEQSDQGQAHALEQGQQAADLAPDPEPAA